jgi:hypothetical protein
MILLTPRPRLLLTPGLRSVKRAGGTPALDWRRLAASRSNAVCLSRCTFASPTCVRVSGDGAVRLGDDGLQHGEVDLVEIGDV